MVKVIRPPSDNVEAETVDMSEDPGYQGPPSRQPIVARLTGGRETDNSCEGAVGLDYNSVCGSQVGNVPEVPQSPCDFQCNHLCNRNEYLQYIPVQEARGGIHHRSRSHSESETIGGPRSHDVTCVRRIIPINRQETSQSITRIRNNNQYVPNTYDSVINNSRIRQEINHNPIFRQGRFSLDSSVESSNYRPTMQLDRRQSLSEYTRDDRVSFDSSNSVPIGMFHSSRHQNDTLQSPEGSRSNPGMRRGSYQAPYGSRLEEAMHRRHSLQMERAVETRDGRLTDDATSLPYSLGANHNHFAVDYIPGDVSQETARVGSDLFLMFLREEIQRLHLQPPDCLNPHENIEPSSSDFLSTREFVQLGVQLRLVANEFSQSIHRERLREQAESVSLGSLDFSSFTDLMFGVFQEGGVTHERIVVLFFFCADLAIRALREKLRARFHELTQWSQMYIMSKLSVWVEQQGGWSVILELSVHKVYRAAIIGVCCMGMIAFWVYIRNNYR